MPATTGHHPNSAKTDFDSLYRELVQAWWSHQELKASKATLGELADSSARLFRTRMAIGSWQRGGRR